MGIVNYLHKFISNLFSINKPLRELLIKSVEWNLMEAQQKPYEELITCITQAPVLKYFDVIKMLWYLLMSPQRVLILVCCKGTNHSLSIKITEQ